MCSGCWCRLCNPHLQLCSYTTIYMHTKPQLLHLSIMKDAPNMLNLITWHYFKWHKKYWAINATCILKWHYLTFMGSWNEHSWIILVESEISVVKGLKDLMELDCAIHICGDFFVCFLITKSLQTLYWSVKTIIFFLVNVVYTYVFHHKWCPVLVLAGITFSEDVGSLTANTMSMCVYQSKTQV